MYRRRGLKTCVATFKVGPGDMLKVKQVVALVQFLDPDARTGDVLLRAVMNLGHSTRIVIRSRGNDPEAILSARNLLPPPTPPTPPADFTGPPESAPRAYNHSRKRGKPFKGLPDKPEPKEY